MSGFKNHPLYVLERHLRREQVVHPAITIGTFRGEAVYPRGNVVELKTAENWMRSEGREVKNGEQPMKMVKIRASTVRRKREVEVAMMEMADRGGGSSDENGVMQGLYAEWQTKFYEPPPVIDVGPFDYLTLREACLHCPSFGFDPSRVKFPRMISAISTCTHHQCFPKEGYIFPVSWPYLRSCPKLVILISTYIDKGIAKIARKLGIDHAEAVVSDATTCGAVTLILMFVVPERLASSSNNAEHFLSLPV